MKRLLLCRGIGTTALKGGVIPNLLHFFALDSILERSLSSCDPASAPLFPPPYISQHHGVLRTISSSTLFVLIVGPRVPTLTSRHGLPSGCPLQNWYSSPSLSPPNHWKSRPFGLAFPSNCHRPRAPCRRFFPHYSNKHLHTLHWGTNAPPSTLHLASIKRPHRYCSRKPFD